MLTLSPNAMTVRDLKNHLLDYPDDFIVFVADPNGSDLLVPLLSSGPERVRDCNGGYEPCNVGEYNAVFLGTDED